MRDQTGVKNPNYSHGLSKSKNYARWSSIKCRCYVPTNWAYKFYGARGIKMYEMWINDFMSFHRYVLSLPNAMKDGYSIDRIDNDSDYVPGNLRWASKRSQAINTRKAKGGTSKYKGVCWDRFRNKWKVEIKVGEKHVHIGRFKHEEEALDARNGFIIENNLKEYAIQQPIIN